jgi:acyl-CoA reductase-like NAD-dependent aldehyde dehydrogenase
MTDLHIPILRHGERYQSLDTVPVASARSGAAVATMSLANAGMIRRDVGRLAAARAALAAWSTDDLVAAMQIAGDHFLHGSLPVGEALVGPDQHLALTSETTGLPQSLVRANMEKNAFVCRNIAAVLAGLTRGLSHDLLDAGYGLHHGVPVALVPAARSLAAVLPSNSPGVHSLWLPAIALKTPVVLKPGSAEPWTALRLIEAMCAAGLPREAFGFYPAGHDGGSALVECHDRALVFGGQETVRRYAHRPGVSVHGPGFAKVVVGADRVEDWPALLDVIVTSVARNGGRSCINASTVVVPRHGDALAAALAERLATLVPRPLDDPKAELAAFASPAQAAAIDAHLDRLLAVPGAREVSAAVRQGPRRVMLDGLCFLQPTVVRADPDHPLARTEFGFPFVSVVELPVEQMVGWLGPTLVVTALTEDPAMIGALLRADHVDRLHTDGVPTTSIRWDQPHEGNLFEWLYRRRAVAGARFGAEVA